MRVWRARFTAGAPHRVHHAGASHLRQRPHDLGVELHPRGHLVPLGARAAWVIAPKASIWTSAHNAITPRRRWAGAAATVGPSDEGVVKRA